MVTRRIVWTVAGVLALVACSTDTRPLRKRSLPIINGTFEPGELAVVGIGDGPGQNGLFCTGTLVSPHVVVAAAHCLEPPAPDRVYFGSDPGNGTATYIAIAKMTEYPGYDPQALTGDISVIVLADVAPSGAIPVTLARTAPTIGQNATFMGFGCTETGQGCGPYGRKLRVDAPITSVDAQVFGYGVATCGGDSGGPAFTTVAGNRVLAGVTSYGDQDCAMYGEDTRVDVYADWVDQQIAVNETATCAVDGACVQGCMPVDPDCGSSGSDGGPDGFDNVVTGSCTIAVGRRRDGPGLIVLVMAGAVVLARRRRHWRVA